ncbi:MAG TPA: RNA methyltransferase [Usitatibacter sp.]
MKKIESRENAAYKAMAKLASSGSERRKTGQSVLDGAHLVAAFLACGRKPEEVMVDASGLADPEVAALVERSAPAPVTLLSDALFKALSTVQTPTGVIARVRTPQGHAVPADAPLVLLLDDIQDPGNVGTLLRSAAAAGAGHVMLSGGCAFAWSPKVLRAAMGAHFALNIVESADLGEFLARFRGASVALDAHAQTSLYELDLKGPAAFIVGNEGAGISPSLLAAAKLRARIPMPGLVESLNAGIAGSICLFEAVRQRRSAMASSAPKRR